MNKIASSFYDIVKKTKFIESALCQTSGTKGLINIVSFSLQKNSMK